MKNRDTGKALPFGEKISFETDLFKGHVFLRLRNDNSTASAVYFYGKKRLYQLVIQGQFKVDDLNFSDLVVGGVFDKRLKGVPGADWRIGKMIKMFMESISPGIIFDIFHNTQPKVLSPVGSGQTISVDLPGEEPTDFDNIVENTSLLSSSGDHIGSSETRRKILSKPTCAAKYNIDKNHVYTFEMYDHTMDLGTFHQHLMGGMKVDLVSKLDGQAVSRSGCSHEARATPASNISVCGAYPAFYFYLSYLKSPFVSFSTAYT